MVKDNIEIIIGLTGRKGSGKSTFAKYLINEHNFKRIPLAQRLKEIARDKFGVIHPKDFEDYYKPNMSEPRYIKPDEVYQKLNVYIPNIMLLDDFTKEKLMMACVKIAWWVNAYINAGEDKEAKNEAARKVYQYIGTEFFRTVDKDFWIDNLIYKIEYDNGYRNIKRFVIDDLRFPNEYEKLKEKFGDKFKLIYIEPNIENTDVDKHESEQYFSYLKEEATYIIKNNFDSKYFEEIKNLTHTLLSHESSHQLSHD